VFIDLKPFKQQAPWQGMLLFQLQFMWGGLISSINQLSSLMLRQLLLVCDGNLWQD